MARDWRDLFITDEPARAETENDSSDGGGDRGGFFRRLRENLSKSRQALGAELQSSVFQTLDEETWERLEETLIYADVGAATTATIVERLETEAGSGDLAGGEQLTARLRDLLAESARAGDDRIDLRHDPTVILMVGVNGTGKTSTCGKLIVYIRVRVWKRVERGRARRERGGDWCSHGWPPAPWRVILLVGEVPAASDHRRSEARELDGRTKPSN